MYKVVLISDEHKVNLNIYIYIQFSSLLSHVQHFVTQWTAALQASCPSPTPRARSNSCPSTGWCYPNISSTVVHFSSCLQSFTAARSFQMSQFLASGGQNIVVSALASVLQWIFRTNSFRMDWLYHLAVQGTLMNLLQHHSSKAPFFFWCSAF